MKRILEEAVARHVELVHYSTSVGIHVGGERVVESGANSGFWLVVLEGLWGKKLKKEEECPKQE